MFSSIFGTKEEKEARKKKVFRRRLYLNPIFLIVAVPVGIYLLYNAYFYVSYYTTVYIPAWYGEYQNKKMHEDFNKMVQKHEDAQKADEYGGETPQETWSLFLDALKKEDIELASKYFIVEKQEEWLGNFKKVIDGGDYNEMLDDLTKNYKFDTEDTAYEKMRNGSIYGYAPLSLNKFTKKWKISDL